MIYYCYRSIVDGTLRFFYATNREVNIYLDDRLRHLDVCWKEIINQSSFYNGAVLLDISGTFEEGLELAFTACGVNCNKTMINCNYEQSNTRRVTI